MSETVERPAAAMGWIGFLVGAAALFMAVTIFWAGPFAPQQTTSVSLGELAAETVKSAARNVAGLEQPEPAPVVRDLDDYLSIAVGVIGCLAVVLGAAALARHEARRPAIAAAVLGGTAIMFQFFAWYAMALLGVLLISALLSSLSEAFGGIFDGLFGG
ncbi:MAG: hypothetical protein AAGK37_09335 [Pseudomonadota bacterium]